MCASDIDLNWKSKLKKIKQMIARWERRNLGVLGKICVIKSLLLSQFVYLLQAICLPETVLTEINTLMYRFLWRKRDCNKRAFEKVKRVVVNSEVEKGGIKMIDVRVMQESFLCQWLIRLSNVKVEGTWTWIPKSHFSVFGNSCTCFSSTIGPKRFKGLNLLKSTFWRQVALTWLRHNKTPWNGSPRTECLWNNENVVYQNQIIYFPDWAQKGFTYINDFLQDGGILSFETVSAIMGSSPNLYLEYFTVHAAVSKYLRCNPEYATAPTESQSHLHFNSKNIMTARLIRIFLVETKYTKPCSVQFWKNKFDYEINESHWCIAANVTTESRLRELHWKIMHNIYPTNILLKKMGLANSEFCPYCINQIDFVEHFFFDCCRMKPLWNYIERKIQLEFGCYVQLDSKSVLLGIIDKENIRKASLSHINYLILLGKMCTSKVLWIFLKWNF